MVVVLAVSTGQQNLKLSLVKFVTFNSFAVDNCVYDFVIFWPAAFCCRICLIYQYILVNVVFSINGFHLQ